ncbi:HD domain-containing protein [Amphibacillus jilinensis]|uniref:HD domain-containing protein n=1 Tax=Amphibacillus jilinensis TaxID=1216008 RepID=UPI0002FE7FAF|nr:HD domain-containing protein [Amphibacillus jilinensis]
MIHNQLMRAISYAATKHDGQQRKVDHTPYIAHPYRVAMLLKEHGCDVNIVIAGLLHDIVEDTSGTFTEIKNLFGEEITELVRYVTEEDKKLKWEERKQNSINKIEQAPFHVKLLVCADKIDNLQSMLDSEMLYGESMWQAFDRGKAYQQWYYQSMYNSVISNLPSETHHPLIIMFKQLLDQFLENRQQRG